MSRPEETPSASKKKRYARPHLHVYGDLQKITQEVGENPHARTDGGMGNPQHIATR